MAVALGHFPDAYPLAVAEVAKLNNNFRVSWLRRGCSICLVAPEPIGGRRQKGLEADEDTLESLQVPFDEDRDGDQGNKGDAGSPSDTGPLFSRGRGRDRGGHGFWWRTVI